LLDLFSSDPTRAILYLLSLVLAFTLHELGHAWVAVRQGDDTPLNEGRLTLNPLRHIDPVGMLLIVLIGFGWAKPVSTRPSRYRNGRLGEFLVSIAGVAANLLLALLALFALRFLGLGSEGGLLVGGGSAPDVVLQALYDLFLVNVMLLVFNLLPFPPLDGSHALSALVPGPLGESLRYHANRTWYAALIAVVLLREQISWLFTTVAGWLAGLIL
jgi:Zn-dependent protease